METEMTPYNCKNGSAWHDWQSAGYEWRQTTYATTKGALLLAANAFASNAGGDLSYCFMLLGTGVTYILYFLY